MPQSSLPSLSRAGKEEVKGSGCLSPPVSASSSYKELVEYCERIILEEADEK